MEKKWHIVFLIVLTLAISLPAGTSRADPLKVINVVTGTRSDFVSEKAIARCLSSDQGIAQVRASSSYNLTVQGISKGSTFIYVWWDKGDFSAIKVYVKDPVIKSGPQSDAPRQLAADKRPLKFKLTNSTYGGNSDSSYIGNKWAYSGSNNTLNIKGSSPFGPTDSYFNYSQYDGVYGLTAFSLNADPENFFFAVGDSSVRFSDITLPYMNYQGILFLANPSDKIEITLAGGARGNAYWGKGANRDTRTAPPFIALRTVSKHIKQLDMNFDAIYSTSESGGTMSGTYGIGLSANLFNSLKLSGNVAANSSGGAWIAETSYASKMLSFKGTYRSIPSAFITPSDFVTYRGVEGFFLSGSSLPFSFLRISGNASRFKNSYLQGASSTAYNKDIRGNIDFIVNNHNILRVSPWKQDHRGYSSGGLAEGTETRLAFNFKFLTQNNFYARYEPSKYTQSSFTTSESDYTNDKTVVGLKIKASDALDLNFENEWDTRISLCDSSLQNSNYFTVLLDYNSNLGSSPLYTEINARYKSGNDATGVLSDVWVETELGYHPSDSTKVYVKAKTADYRGSASNVADRTEKHISFGFVTELDSSMTWSGAGQIDGYVFKDINGNGIMDGNETGIPNVILYCKGKTTATNSNGRYIFKGVAAAETKVGVDLASVGKNYIMTSQSPALVRVYSGQTARANFGLTTRSGVFVKVFVDKNRNGKFDANDVAGRGIAFMIDEIDYRTDSAGEISDTKMTIGKHRLSIDIKSLPKNYVPAVPIKQEINVEEGTVKLIMVPLVESGKAPAKKIKAAKKTIKIKKAPKKRR